MVLQISLLLALVILFSQVTRGKMIHMVILGSVCFVMQTSSCKDTSKYMPFYS